ncbi:MAG: hypothetical protein ACOX1A_03925 [Saccharofermentanales bacterium]
MKQSNSKEQTKAKIYQATDLEIRYSKKDRDKTAFIYVRISREDDLETDSYSIQNQAKAPDPFSAGIRLHRFDSLYGRRHNRSNIKSPRISRYACQAWNTGMRQLYS